MELKQAKDFALLLTKYQDRKHPLEYQNRYQLMVMVILSAQDSDKHINSLAPALFQAYPSLAHLAKASPEELEPYIGKVTNSGNKLKWLTNLAQSLQDDANIPTTLDELVKLPGIGRKSANAIIRESGGKAEGVIVDLHVVRVAPRIGFATGERPDKIEKQLMTLFPPEQWNQLGMAISFLGREICRPTSPKCDVCVINSHCDYFAQTKGA